MRIAFTGPQAVGKSTLIQQFMQRWPAYKTPEKTYRDIIAKKKLKLNKKGDKESQRVILDALIDELQHVVASEEKNVLFDRCVLDNIIYSLWLNTNKRVDDDFIVQCKTIAAETLKLYDIIFYLPIHESIKVTDKVTRDTDLVYRQEIGNIFDAVISTYERGKGIFFPLNDSPAVITLDVAPSVRCEQISLYLKDGGEPHGEDTPSLITPYYS